MYFYSIYFGGLRGKEKITGWEECKQWQKKEETMIHYVRPYKKSTVFWSTHVSHWAFLFFIFFGHEKIAAKIAESIEILLHCVL